MGGLSDLICGRAIKGPDDCCVQRNYEALKSDSYGRAIYSCYERETTDGGPKELWVGNGEYESQVNYCPYCGKKAEVQVAMQEETEEDDEDEEAN